MEKHIDQFKGSVPLTQRTRRTFMGAALASIATLFLPKFAKTTEVPLEWHHVSFKGKLIAVNGVPVVPTIFYDVRGQTEFPVYAEGKMLPVSSMVWPMQIHKEFWILFGYEDCLGDDIHERAKKSFLKKLKDGPFERKDGYLPRHGEMVMWATPKVKQCYLNSSRFPELIV